MLEDLYERKHCNSLLVPKADEDVRWVQEKQPSRRRRTITIDSGSMCSICFTEVVMLLWCNFEYLRFVCD